MASEHFIAFCVGLNVGVSDLQSAVWAFRGPTNPRSWPYSSTLIQPARFSRLDAAIKMLHLLLQQLNPL